MLNGCRDVGLANRCDGTACMMSPLLICFLRVETCDLKISKDWESFSY